MRRSIWGQGWGRDGWAGSGGAVEAWGALQPPCAAESASRGPHAGLGRRLRPRVPHSSGRSQGSMWCAPITRHPTTHRPPPPPHQVHLGCLAACSPVSGQGEGECAEEHHVQQHLACGLPRGRTQGMRWLEQGGRHSLVGRIQRASLRRRRGPSHSFASTQSAPELLTPQLHTSAFMPS